MGLVHKTLHLDSYNCHNCALVTYTYTLTRRTLFSGDN